MADLRGKLSGCDRRSLGSEQAFTLMEMLITMAILGILVAVGASLMTSLFDSQIRQGQMLDQQTTIETYYGFMAARLAPAQRPIGIISGGDQVDPLSLAGDQIAFESNGACYRVFWIGPDVNNRATDRENMIRATVASSCTDPKIDPVRGPNQAPADDDNSDGFAEPDDPDFDLAIDSLAPNWATACNSYNSGEYCNFQPIDLADGIVEDRPPYPTDPLIPATLRPFTFITDSSALPFGGPTGPTQQASSTDNNAFYNTSAGAESISSVDVTAYIEAMANQGVARVNDRYYKQNISLQQICSVPGGTQGAQAGGDLTGAYPDPEIKSGVVGSSEITDDSITANDIGANAVGTSELGSLATAKVQTSASQSIANGAGSGSIVNLGSPFFETPDSMWVAGTPNRIIAPVTGIYRIDGSVLWFDNSTNGYRQLDLIKNGSTSVAVSTLKSPGAGSFHSVGGILKLNANDYIEMKATQTTGGAISIVQSGDATSLSMSLISKG